MGEAAATLASSRWRNTSSALFTVGTLCTTGATAIGTLVKTFGLEPVLAERLVGIGINSPAAFEGVGADDLVDAGFTTEEAAAIISRVGGAQ